MGGRTPKQFLRLGGETILTRTVRVFDAHPSIDEIVVVAPRDFCAKAGAMLRKCRKVTKVVPGGAERQGSVRRGLEALQEIPSVVLIQDAVRPFIPRRLIDAVIDGAIRFGAVVVGTPVRDTVKEATPRGRVLRTLPRKSLWAVQTPQGFRYELYARAHREAFRAHFVGTDDASLVERIGFPVRMVSGDEGNLKITTAGDLLLARFLLGVRTQRRAGKR